MSKFSKPYGALPNGFETVNFLNETNRQKCHWTTYKLICIKIMNYLSQKKLELF